MAPRLRPRAALAVGAGLGAAQRTQRKVLREAARAEALAFARRNGKLLRALLRAAGGGGRRESRAWRRAEKGRRARGETRTARRVGAPSAPQPAHTNRHADQLNRLFGDQARAVRRPVLVARVALRRHVGPVRGLRVWGKRGSVGEERRDNRWRRTRFRSVGHCACQDQQTRSVGRRRAGAHAPRECARAQ